MSPIRHNHLAPSDLTLQKEIIVTEELVEKFRERGLL